MQARAEATTATTLLTAVLDGAHSELSLMSSFVCGRFFVGTVILDDRTNIAANFVDDSNFNTYPTSSNCKWLGDLAGSLHSAASSDNLRSISERRFARTLIERAYGGTIAANTRVNALFEGVQSALVLIAPVGRGQLSVSAI